MSSGWVVNSLAWAGPLTSFMPLAKSLYRPGSHYTQITNGDPTSNIGGSFLLDKAHDFCLFLNWLGMEQSQWLQVLTVLGRRKYIARIPQKPEMVSWVRTSYFLVYNTSRDKLVLANSGMELNWCVQSLGVSQSAKEAVTDLNFLRVPGNFWLMGLKCIDNVMSSPLKWGITVVMMCVNPPSRISYDLPDSEPRARTGAGSFCLISQMRRLRLWKHKGLVRACSACEW